VRSGRACVMVAALTLAASAAAAGGDSPAPPVAPVEQAEPALAPSAGRDIRAALGCWRRLARVDTPSDHEGRAARAAVDRLFATDPGLALVEGLCTLFQDAETGVPRAAIVVDFVDELPCRDGTDGCFRPSTPGAERYEVFVRTHYSRAASDPTLFVFGEYPSNPECSVVFFYQEPASFMAQALYHELLHVWYVNARASHRPTYQTGHGKVESCQFEDDFLELLRSHAAALAVLEGRAPKPLMRARTPPSSAP